MLSYLWHSRFVRDVALVAGGAAGAQAITVSFAPFITRIYGPEAFGLLGLFTAIVSVTVPLAAFAYPIAIVLEKDDRDALGLVKVSLLLAFGVAITTTALLVVGGGWLSAMLGAEDIAGYLYLVPIAMFFSACLQITQQWLIRKKAYRVCARAAIIHSIFLNTAKTGLGWLYPVGTVLIVLATLGNAFHAALMCLGALSIYKPIEHKSKERRSATLGELVSRHRDFPLFRAPQNFISAASQSLPVIMLAAYFGSTAAGFFTLAKMIMMMPTTLVGKAVYDVFYPRITEAAHNGEDLPRKIMWATSVLFVVGIIPFGIVVVYGPWIFSLVFGAEWGVAGEYARWLALFYLFNFINNPSVSAVPVLGIQRGLLVYELFSTGAKVIGLVAGFYWFESDILAVAIFSIVGVVSYVALILWVFFKAIKWRGNVTSPR